MDGLYADQFSVMQKSLELTMAFYGVLGDDDYISRHIYKTYSLIKVRTPISEKNHWNMEFYRHFQNATFINLQLIKINFRNDDVK